jgi:hypothetical protein
MANEPKVLTKPAVVVHALNLSNVEIRRRNQYSSGLWVETPAMADWTALATKRLAKTSLQSGEMTERPTKCLVVTAPGQAGLYFIPGIDHPDAIEVKYINGRAKMNLVKVFTALDKLITPGNREFFPIVWPDHPISFDGQEYKVVMMQSVKTATKRVKTNKARVRARKLSSGSA